MMVTMIVIMMMAAARGSKFFKLLQLEVTVTLLWTFRSDLEGNYKLKYS
jgi:hypothetical protein